MEEGAAEGGIVKYTVAWATPEGWRYARAEGSPFPERPEGMGDRAWERLKGDWMHAITGPVGCPREATAIVRPPQIAKLTIAIVGYTWEDGSFTKVPLP